MMWILEFVESVNSSLKTDIIHTYIIEFCKFNQGTTGIRVLPSS